MELGSLVQLIEIDGTAFGLDTVQRFHAYNLPSIIWQGNEYDPHPYELTGMEMSSTGSLPTPKLFVGNVGNYVTALCLNFDDMGKASGCSSTPFHAGFFLCLPPGWNPSFQ